ncbi:MAG: tyrosine/phenylalanine carboxypeptidase domain-containing protein, partial [Ktedonobacteraceae bacterium]
MEHTPRRAIPLHFGLLLRMRREQWQIKQREVMPHLPGWTQATYSRIESSILAPAFEDLLTIYKALSLAGVQWTTADQRHFLALARQRIEEKKTHCERRSDAEWAELYYQLTLVDPVAEPSSDADTPSEPLLADTRHLIGREAWLDNVIHAIEQTTAKKLVALHGPMGIGKSSELHRLARHFLQTDRPKYEVLWLPIRRDADPTSALESFLSNILAEQGELLPPSAPPPLDRHISYVLTYLAQNKTRTVIFLDNAERILDTDGRLAPCWEQFLERFLRSQHRVTLVLASSDWPGWSGRETTFVTETTVPPLPIETSMLLLQRLGLAEVPLPQLRAISERVGGIPLGLEWIVTLVQDPLLLSSWDSFTLDAEPTLTERLQRLLETPSLLQGHFANKLHPLLDRVIEQRLSAEARRLLHTLAVTSIPLGKPALQVLCEHPKPVKELRDASLLVAYASRVQLLPMVAAAILHRLTAEQVQEAETHLITALSQWLKEGTPTAREGGNIVAELVELHLKHHHLVDAAQLLIVYGWMSFNQGHAPHLAQLAQQILKEVDWHSTAEFECAGFAILSILFPFLGKPFNTNDFVNRRHICDALFLEKTVLPVEIESYVTQLLMMDAMSESQFANAQSFLNAYITHLEGQGMTDVNQNLSILQKHAWLMGTWCEYAEEKGEKDKARMLREQAIDLYRQCEQRLSTSKEESLFANQSSKRQLASYLNSLSYHLNRVGQYEEALQVIERAIILQEQGYVYIGALAASYGEKSQILMELGRFQEAVLFDEKAMREILHSADAGNILSQEDVWTYRVNRGRLYLRLGRINEAEQLLQEAKSHVHPRRSMYRMFAEEAQEEIKQWRRYTTSSQYQLDWRWIRRYREMTSHDSYWWLTWAGPFTDEEQRQWDRLFVSPVDETIKAQLAPLLKQSRERELEVAFVEQREPRLCYPAVEIEEVRQRIASLLQLDAKINREEPNVIVRRLYHGTIKEELDFLHLIQATYENDTEKFWQSSLALFPLPTTEEMEYALSRVNRVLIQGLDNPETRALSRRLEEILQMYLYITLDRSPGKQTYPPVLPASTQSEREISALATSRFFEAVLSKCGYDDWKIVVDPNATNARIEQSLRRIFLPDQRFSLEEIRHLLSHELLGHVSRCVAGEHSPLGLLGVGTKNSSSIEEGLALFYEREVMKLHGQAFDDSSIWFGTLVIGLASGVITPA